MAVLALNMNMARARRVVGRIDDGGGEPGACIARGPRHVEGRRMWPQKATSRGNSPDPALHCAASVRQNSRTTRTGRGPAVTRPALTNQRES
jgi:hypothetical protein